MQLTMKKMGAAAIAAALALCVAPAMAMLTPGTAHAAGKTNFNSSDTDINVEIYTAKYDVKKGTSKDLSAYKGGKQVKPKVEVTEFQPGSYDADGNYTPGKTVKLKKGKDYTIAYKNNKNVGHAYVVIKGKGKYKGTIARDFDISPKATKVTKVKGAKKALKVSWKKLSAKQADGYIVSVYTRGGKYTETEDNGKKYTRYRYHFEKSQVVKGASAATATVKGLKAKTKYYVTVTPYKAATGSYMDTVSKYNSKDEYVGTRIVTRGYADTLYGYSSDYKAGKTK